MIRERARAKINLTLNVVGRRPDGFHELESLVAFADTADELTLDTTRERRVETTGPFGGSIAGENLLTVTLATLKEAEPRLRLGAVTLEKNLPVAAGIGGGSADAAALLRAVRTANPEFGDAVDWQKLAQALGADVPVCFTNTAAVMRGTGERLEAVENFAPLDAVLVNPLVAVPPDKTARVFRTLGAPQLAPALVRESEFLRCLTLGQTPVEQILDFLRVTGNDLTPAAITVVPEIETVLSALKDCSDVAHVALSGGGPTCFAIFPDQARARSAAQTLKSKHPNWWIEATRLS